MEVKVGLAVGLPHGRRVHMLQPVVSRHLAGHVQDQPAQRIALIGVGVDAPVLAGQIFVDRSPHIDHAAAVGTQQAVLLAVGDVGTRRFEMAGLDQHGLGFVLDALDVRHAAGQPRGDTLCQVLRTHDVELAGGDTRACQRVGDLADLERRALAFALDDRHRRERVHLELMLHALPIVFGTGQKRYM